MMAVECCHAQWFMQLHKMVSGLMCFVEIHNVLLHLHVSITSASTVKLYIAKMKKKRVNFVSPVAIFKH